MCSATAARLTARALLTAQLGSLQQEFSIVPVPVLPLSGVGEHPPVINAPHFGAARDGGTSVTRWIGQGLLQCIRKVCAGGMAVDGV